MRLIGGGGRCTIALPPDGAIRNPVRILPSPLVREVWTMLLRGGLIGGGKPMAFLDGGVAGFSIAGQEFHFEALNDAIIQIADPLVPGARLIVDVQRKAASLVLTLPPWTEAMNPAAALTEAIGLLSAPEEVREGALPPMFHSDASGQPPAPVQLVSRLDTGELLSGLLNPVTGAALLYGAHHLLMLERPRAGWPLPAWRRYALRGGELSLSDDKRPSVRYDGGRNFGPVTFTYQTELRRFVRDRLAMTEAGKRALMAWSRAHPGWTREDLRRFLTSELAAGVELAGPEGGAAMPVELVDYHYQNVEGRLPTEGWTAMALWSRLDRLQQVSQKDGPILLDGDPTLGRDMVRAGLATFPETGTVAAVDVDRALQWLALTHAQATGAYGAWSDLHPPAPPLTLQRRTDLVRLRDALLELLERHRKAGDGAHWIKLGDTPQASELMAHRLRDAGVDIRIDDADQAPASRSTDRSGPTDFYDVQEPSLRLFMHDVTDLLERDAAVVRQLQSVRPPGPSDTPLQASLTRLAASRAVAAGHGAPVSPVPADVLEQVRRAGLTYWSPAVDQSPLSGSSTGEPERSTASGATGLGRVSYTDAGGMIDNATLRWWRAQAATQGLLLDAWYVSHAVPGSPMEVLLRPAAVDALRDRLIRLQAQASRMDVPALPLHDDTILQGQLLAALRRLLPDVAAVKVAGQDTAVPGDVVRFVDDHGRSHYALMRRPDTNLLQLHRDPAALRGNPFWAYLCPVEDLDEHLRPPLPRLRQPRRHRSRHLLQLAPGRSESGDRRRLPLPESAQPARRTVPPPARQREGAADGSPLRPFPGRRLQQCGLAIPGQFGVAERLGARRDGERSELVEATDLLRGPPRVVVRAVDAGRRRLPQFPPGSGGPGSHDLGQFDLPPGGERHPAHRARRQRCHDVPAVRRPGVQALARTVRERAHDASLAPDTGQRSRDRSGRRDVAGHSGDRDPRRARRDLPTHRP
ncbi:hypothetical protein [Roseateles chitinivorans]|uniref:hypothetical protein n=1 Tax=Roseateles chitinivorans TaxID=2917965 RepID=UPI003D67013B